jgi:molybdopterin synthase catalytic subunit
MACSWGSFQVLAEYYEQCDFKSLTDLVDACMRSPDGHIALFRGFLKMPEKKRAVEALKTKNWEQITQNKWQGTTKSTRKTEVYQC